MIRSVNLGLLVGARSATQRWSVGEKESGWVSIPLRLFGSTGPYALFSYNYRCPNKECKVKWTIAHRCKLSRLARAFLPFEISFCRHLKEVAKDKAEPKCVTRGTVG